MVGNRREISVDTDCLGRFDGVWGRDTEEARDRTGLGGAEGAIELARERETRRSGSGGGEETRFQPNRDARIALSEGSGGGSGGACASSPFVLSEGW